MQTYIGLTLIARSRTLKSLSLLTKIFLLLVVGLFAFTLVKVTISTTAQSAQSKRQLDDRIPAHLPIKIKIKKDKEEGFQDLNNEHWPSDFQVEVKNTGDRPIYALSLVWELVDVRMLDGTAYGSTFRYGRGEFITDPGERPTPEDVPIQPGETHVFKLSQMSVGGLERWVRDNNLPTPKTIMVWHNFVCFGEGTCLEGPQGQNLHRKRAVAFYSPNKGDPVNCNEQSRSREPWLRLGFSIVPATFEPANFLSGESSSNASITGPDICCPGTSCSKIKQRLGRCYCSSLDFPTIDDKEFSVTTSCTDPNGLCGTTIPLIEECDFPGIDFPLFCTQSVFVPCGSPPSPTPTNRRVRQSLPLQS